jgi:hypothetical protein
MKPVRVAVVAVCLSLSFSNAAVRAKPAAPPLGFSAAAAPEQARGEAELVGLIPSAALAGYPEDVPIRDFDPQRRTIEGRLAALS